MKNELFHLLVVICAGLIVSQSKAQQIPLTFGIDRSTGNLIATDVWNSREYDEMAKDSGRKQDEQTGELIKPSNGATSSTLPEINISIAKQNDFLLITFSPMVTNANLEQASLNSYPWAWQPAVTATNSATNGWYVVPTLEPRVFRIRINR